MSATVRDAYPPTEVQLECGCVYMAHHRIGDRLFICDHRERYVISAIPPKDIQYHVQSLTRPPAIEDVDTKGKL